MTLFMGLIIFIQFVAAWKKYYFQSLAEIMLFSAAFRKNTKLEVNTNETNFCSCPDGSA